MTLPAAFLTLYSGLDREGPGEAADVLWALDRLGVAGPVSVCDAGCGSGADCLTLGAALPEARIEGVEALPHLVAEAGARISHLPHVRVRHGDMEALTGPYDLIWSAGALYFLGVTEGLRRWRDALVPGGAVAFSEPVLLGGAEPEAVRAFWQDYPRITDIGGIVARVASAGYRSLDVRIVSGAPWAGYYGALETRIATLRPGADAEMMAVLDGAAREIALWRAAPERIAYALVLARPS